MPTRKKVSPSPTPQPLAVSLQFNLKLHTFLDAFDVLDYIQEDADARGVITNVIQDTLRAEDAGLVITIDSIEFGRAERRPPTVVEYFEDKLGVAWPYPINAANPSSPANLDFHIETGCGRDCANAIDAAVEAIRHVRKGFGDDEPELIKGIVDACSAVVRVYVYG